MHEGFSVKIDAVAQCARKRMNEHERE
jgi:hypothetical protein